MPHPAALTDDALLRDCEIRFLRRSGPGGQHRNKVETAVRLLHTPTGLSAEANERRSQAANRAVALKRLRLKLALEIRGEFSAADSPTELWQSRCRNRKIAVNADHADFPLLLAEALDALARENFELRAAAEPLEISGTQLVKLLKKEPAAFAQVNRERAARELPSLR